MLEKLKWPTLTDRRDDLKLVMLYKIIHGYVHVQLTLPLTYSSLNSVTRGHHNKILQPPTRTEFYKYSFFPTAIRLWDNLPASLSTLKTIDEFKNLLVNINKQITLYIILIIEVCTVILIIVFCVGRSKGSTVL